MNVRTDLALEAKEIYERSAARVSRLSGVTAEEKTVAGTRVTRVRILDGEGEKKLNKPKGTYITVELDSFLKREDDGFAKCVATVADEIKSLITLGGGDAVLVASLGNDKVTPDSVGPAAADSIMATRHLIEADPESFGTFRPVSVLSVGVMGTTGIESSEMIAAVSKKISPSLIIAIDALASSSAERLCRTVQITDTGISPGSGVGNSRKALSRETLGVPVIAVGVPTVVDAETMLRETAEKYGVTLPDAVTDGEKADAMFVTRKDIDSRVADISKVIGYAVNMALHDGLTVADMEAFLS